MKRNRIMSKITLFLAFIILIAIIISKIIYYIHKLKIDYFKGIFDFGIWTCLSIFISITPMLLLIIPSIADIIGKKKLIYDAFVIPSVMALVFNVIFEIVSLLGSAMCLDLDYWMDMAFLMLGFHFFSIIPVVLAVINNIEQRAVRRKIMRENAKKYGGKYI